MPELVDVGLHRALGAALGGPVGSIAAHQRLGKRVYRLRVASDGRVRAVVVKRLSPRAAECNELVARRWLPAVQLERHAPPLLGAAPDHRRQTVWHVYQDLGDSVLDSLNPDLDKVRAVVEAVALIHVRCAGHPLLADCRMRAGDLGMAAYGQNVRAALNALNLVRPPAVELQAHQAAVRDRLLRHLSALLIERPARSRAMDQLGGPQTLLHGDLWTTNTLVTEAPEGPRVHLIDWDRAGVGPVCYDLSTFLLRFPPQHRPAIMDIYRAAVGRLGWRLPTDAELNALFDTAERARYANYAIWPALAVMQPGGAWGFDALAAVADWFDALRPVLPTAKVRA